MNENPDVKCTRKKCRYQRVDNVCKRKEIILIDGNCRSFEVVQADDDGIMRKETGEYA